MVRDLGNPSRRRVIKTIGATAVLSAPWVRRVDAADVLYINTWGGSWEDAAKQHLFTALPRRPAPRYEPSRRSRSPNWLRRHEPAFMSST